jgi:hypothetical protein
MQGRDAVTACFFGDYQYAMGTALSRHESLTDLCVKPRAHQRRERRRHGCRGNGGRGSACRERSPPDPEPVLPGGAHVPVPRPFDVRSGALPDPELYRSKEEVQEWVTKHDPIANFRADLQSRGWLDEGADAAIEQRAASAVDQAVAEAEAGAFQPVEDLLKDVLLVPEGGAPHDLSRSNSRRPAAGARRRPARIFDGRRRRALRGRVRRQQRPTPGVRPGANPGYAPFRVDVRGRGHRRGTRRHAADRGNHDRQFQPAGARSDRQQRGSEAPSRFAEAAWSSRPSSARIHSVWTSS